MENYLYIWNPKQWPWEELPDAAQSMSSGETYVTDWSCGNTKKIQIGDLFLMIRLGIEPKGILGYGYINSAPEYAPHWQPAMAKEGKKQLRTDVEFVTLNEQPIVDLKALNEHFPDFNWTPKCSGLSVPAAISADLVKLIEANTPDSSAKVIAHGEIPSNPDDSDGAGDRHLARISYNSAGWERPTGDAAKQETGDTYNAKHKFGHEDWLFREKWQIDGWRYAFIEGFNTKQQTYAGTSLDVSLYTIEPDKRCRLVGTINQVEGLTESQAGAAVEAFKTKGWFTTMKAEIEAIGGDGDTLGQSHWTPHILNVRFRADNVDLYPDDTYLESNKWIKDRRRYILYKFDQPTQDAVERTAAIRKGSHDAPKSKRLFRKGTKPLEYTPEHQNIQQKLVKELKKDYPKGYITCERDFVDVRVETQAELIYFEIKTDLNTRSVIRQALGQLLEYAYHPARDGRQPDKLVIVGRSALTGADAEYLHYLSNELKLPLSYRQVED